MNTPPTETLIQIGDKITIGKRELEIIRSASIGGVPHLMLSENTMPPQGKPLLETWISNQVLKELVKNAIITRSPKTT